MYRKFIGKAKMSRQLNSEVFSVSPKTMTFYAPYDRTQRRLITVLNPTSTRMLYKIRSNAPCVYTASPNCGCIEPYDFAEVNISLSHFDYQPDKDYGHRFSIQCIKSPKTKQIHSQSILDIFKRTNRSDVKCVRVAVELKAQPIPITQEELDILLQHDCESTTWKTPSTNIDYINSLEQLDMPTEHGNRCRCRWTRYVMTFLILMSCLVAAYVHRLQIEDDLHLHFKMDNLQL